MINVQIGSIVNLNFIAVFFSLIMICVRNAFHLKMSIFSIIGTMVEKNVDNSVETGATSLVLRVFQALCQFVVLALSWAKLPI